jgi:LPS-assembly lipoprotein
MQNFVSIRGLLVAASLLALSACGFHLRGGGSLPFNSLYVQGGGSDLVRDLKRSLSVSGVKITNTPEEAEAALEIMSEESRKNILSLSSKGKVREYEIVYHAIFRVKPGGSELWGDPQTVELRRDFTYDDAQLLAKDAEEARLATDMRNEAVREILRRVSSLSKQMGVQKAVPAETGAAQTEPAQTEGE